MTDDDELEEDDELLGDDLGDDDELEADDVGDDDELEAIARRMEAHLRRAQLCVDRIKQLTREH